MNESSVIIWGVVAGILFGYFIIPLLNKFLYPVEYEAFVTNCVDEDFDKFYPRSLTDDERDEASNLILKHGVVLLAFSANGKLEMRGGEDGECNHTD